MTVDGDAAKRAGDSSQHVVIVGKFSRKMKDGKPYATYHGFVNAEKILTDFGFELLTSEKDIKVNGKETYKTIRVHVPAELKRNKAGKEVIEVAGEKITSFGSLPITGTALEKEFKNGMAPNSTELGGKLLTELKRNLNVLIPFSGPGFDRLLSEALYFSYNSKTIKIIETDLRGIIYETKFNRLVTTYLRAADEEDAERILKKASDAYPKAIRESGQRELMEHIRALRDELRKEDLSKIKEFALLDVNPGEVDFPFALASFSRDLKNRKLDIFTLRQFYQKYTEANRAVTGVSRSETLMMFMVRWLLDELAPNIDTDFEKKRDKIVDQNYNEGKGWIPENKTDEEKKQLNELFVKKLDERHQRNFPGGEESLPALAEENENRQAKDFHYALRNPELIWSNETLLGEIGKIVVDLAAKDIPGGVQVAEVRALAQMGFAKAERAINRQFKRDKSGRRILAKTSPAGKPAGEALQADLQLDFAAWDKEFGEAVKKIIAKLQPNLKKQLAPLARIALGLGKILEGVQGANDSEKLFMEVNVALVEAEDEIVGQATHFFKDAAGELKKAGTTLQDGTVEGLKAAADDGTLLGGCDTVGLAKPGAQYGEVPGYIRAGEVLPTKKAPALEAVQAATMASTSASPEIGAEARTGTQENTSGNQQQPEAGAGSDSDGKAPNVEELLNDPANSAFTRNYDGSTTINTDLTWEELIAAVGEDNEEWMAGVLKNHWLGKEKADVLQGFRNARATDPDFGLTDPGPDAKRREALMRAKLFGEFLLGTPKDATILGKHDRSLIAGLVFELLYHVNPNDVRLAKLLPAADLKRAKTAVEVLWQAVRGQTDGLRTELQSYFKDMKDVTELLSALRLSNDSAGWVTFVNATIAERGHESYEDSPDKFEPIFETAGKVITSGEELENDIPPPGIVYVTRQAFHPNLEGEARSLKPIKDKMESVPNRSPFWINRGEKPEKALIATNPLPTQLGWPLYVGRGFEPTSLPSIVVDVEKLGSLILVLLGQHPSQILGGSLASAYHAQTKRAATQDTTFSKFWLGFLTEGARRDLGAVLSSHTVAHAIAVRQIAMKKGEATLPDFGTSLEWAVEVVGKRFDCASPASQEWLRNRVWWWQGGKPAALAQKGLKGKFTRKSDEEKFSIADAEPAADAPSENLVGRFDLINPR